MKDILLLHIQFVPHVYMSVHVQNLLSEEYLASCMYSSTVCIHVCTCTESVKWRLSCLLYVQLYYMCILCLYMYRIYEVKIILLLVCTVVLHVYMSVHVRNQLTEGYLATLCTTCVNVCTCTESIKWRISYYFMYSCTTCVHVHPAVTPLLKLYRRFAYRRDVSKIKKKTSDT